MDRIQAVDETEALLALAFLPGVGPRTVRLLCQHCGRSALRVWETPVEELAEIPEIRPQALEALRRANIEEARGEIEKAARAGIRILPCCGPDYPSPLFDLYAPPPVLYVRGEISASDIPGMAVVGTRHPSQYGRRQAYCLGRALAEKGIAVVSGLARGVDVAAHQGAMDGNGRTIAVLGNGLPGIYPHEHRKIADRIAENGALVSECRMHADPLPHHFPQRNRIISGLSSGVVVVEGRRNSGALITADCALEQGRDVFALPGEIDNPQSEGPNWLIQQGAKLIASPAEILEELPARREVRSMTEEEEKIWQSLENEPLSIEMLSRRTQLPPAVVNSRLLNMEIEGLVANCPGGRYTRKL